MNRLNPRFLRHGRIKYYYWLGMISGEAGYLFVVDVKPVSVCKPDVMFDVGDPCSHTAQSSCEVCFQQSV